MSITLQAGSPSLPEQGEINGDSHSSEVLVYMVIWVHCSFWMVYRISIMVIKDHILCLVIFKGDAACSDSSTPMHHRTSVLSLNFETILSCSDSSHSSGFELWFGVVYRLTTNFKQCVFYCLGQWGLLFIVVMIKFCIGDKINLIEQLPIV